jgi:uncharacterized protein YbcI
LRYASAALISKEPDTLPVTTAEQVEGDLPSGIPSADEAAMDVGTRAVWSIDDASGTRTELAREISREMVALTKARAGRGPTYARTYIHGNLVVTILGGTMTTAEQTLLHQDGGEDHVRDFRRVIDGASRSEAKALIQRVTGRRVVACLSDHAVAPDWAIAAFVLEDQSH